MHEDDYDYKVRVTVLVSGATSATCSLVLLVLLGGWLYKLIKLAETCDVRVRTRLCHFMCQLALCDLFASLSYVLAFFVEWYSAQWYCIMQGAWMLIFEQGSLLWTASLAFLLWRISILCAPTEKWERAEWEAEMRKLYHTEIVCTTVSWGIPLMMAASGALADAYGRPDGANWCFLASHWWVELSTFYVPLWLILVFCSVMLVLNYLNYHRYRSVLLQVLKERKEKMCRASIRSIRKSTSISSPASSASSSSTTSSSSSTTSTTTTIATRVSYSRLPSQPPSPVDRNRNRIRDTESPQRSPPNWSQRKNTVTSLCKPSPQFRQQQQQQSERYTDCIWSDSDTGTDQDDTIVTTDEESETEREREEDEQQREREHEALLQRHHETDIEADNENDDRRLGEYEAYGTQVVEDFKRNRNLVFWFLGLFIVIWFWVSLGFVMDTVSQRVFILDMFKYACAPLQGFANFIVYGVIYLNFPFVLWKGWHHNPLTDIATGSI
eukprot:TRINITY_DN7273_c0_g1_i1.p1 TRINITY_DN7273_c0_g1~~TRINITY_DN7273_c0_g1_i1.p1  ORF type:complete len:496 (-),score=80.53 TRINITY_DN7273_c0_g1_i1:61-1548(-)